MRYSNKVLASLAINACLAVAIFGFIGYQSTTAELGAGLVRGPTTSLFRPVQFRTTSYNRQMNVGAQKLREAVADEYGTGLAQMAKEEGIIEKVQNDLNVWKEVFKTEPQVRDFMYDPLASITEKQGLVKDVVGKAGMQDYTANFLNLLLDMGRFDQLEEIANVFEEEIMEMQGTKAVTVRTAYELDDDAMLKIAEKVKQLSGYKNIQMQQELDEDLIAGFVVDMDSQQIDLSLKNELEQIKAEMLKPSTAMA